MPDHNLVIKSKRLLSHILLLTEPAIVGIFFLQPFKDGGVVMRQDDGAGGIVTAALAQITIVPGKKEFWGCAVDFDGAGTRCVAAGMGDGDAWRGT